MQQDVLMFFDSCANSLRSADPVVVADKQRGVGCFLIVTDDRIVLCRCDGGGSETMHLTEGSFSLRRVVCSTSSLWTKFERSNKSLQCRFLCSSARDKAIGAIRMTASDNRQSIDFALGDFDLCESSEVSWCSVEEIPRELYAVLEREQPFVVDRLKDLRTQLQMVESTSNKSIAEISESFDQAFTSLTRENELINTELSQLLEWERTLDSKSKLLIVAQSDLRNAKDSVTELTLEMEKALVKFTHELQGWRKVLSEKHATELSVRESSLQGQSRCEVSLLDSRRNVQELHERLSDLEGRLAYFDSEIYQSATNLRNETLAHLRSLQESGKRFDALYDDDSCQALPENSTNSSLRKLYECCVRDVANEKRVSEELLINNQRLGNEIISIEDSCTVVELERSQSEAILHATRCSLEETKLRTQCLREQYAEQTQGQSSHTRFRLAKVRARQARSQRNAVEQCGVRATSAQQTSHCDIQQQLFFETLRSGSSKGSSFLERFNQLVGGE